MTLLIQTALLLASLRPIDNVPLAERLSPLEMESVTVAHERVALPVETHLLTPEGSTAAAVDPRSGTKFGALCYAYLKENGIYVRRFAVHAPDREELPLARNAARFLSILWGAADQRYGTLSHRLRAKPVDVWLTRSGEAGGEQIGSSIYIYDLQSERSPIEWARELAHEYGHYLLPGASGYTDPESWSNGLLGERLFLRWLREDIASARMKADLLPFVKPADIDGYCEKQSDPLTDRIRKRGVDMATLRKRDADAMDEFSALLLFADATYGPKSLLDLLDYLPNPAGAKGEDFLTALTQHLANASKINMRAPAGSTRVLLPKGKYKLTATDVQSITLDRGTLTPAGTAAWTVALPETGWRMLTVKGGKEPLLRWERQ